MAFAALTVFDSLCPAALSRVPFVLPRLPCLQMAGRNTIIDDVERRGRARAHKGPGLGSRVPDRARDATASHGPLCVVCRRQASDVHYREKLVFIDACTPWTRARRRAST